jgi:hypothetical protein
MPLLLTMVVANPPHKENHKNYDPKKGQLVFHEAQGLTHLFQTQ